MPDRGRLDPSNITAGPLLRGEQAEPWVMPGARWAQVTFEVLRTAALAVMPEDVTSPVPCYARLLVVDAPRSPAGALRLAALTVGGRYGLIPRNVLVDAVVDGPVEAVRGAFGAPFRGGTVLLSAASGGATTVHDDAGRALASVDLPELQLVDPAMLRWDSWLGFAGPGDNIDLVGYRFIPTISMAQITKQARVSMGGSSETWSCLASVQMISGCYCEGEIELSSPEVLQALV